MTDNMRMVRREIAAFVQDYTGKRPRVSEDEARQTIERLRRRGSLYFDFLEQDLASRLGPYVAEFPLGELPS